MAPTKLFRFALAFVLIAGCSDSTSPPSSPVVEAVSPPNAPLAGGVTLTITGRNFSGVTSVTVGGSELINRQIVGSTQITGTVPAATSAGPRDVVVAAGTATGRCTACFVYLGLSVDAVTPTAGPVAGGVTVTITGTNFTNVTSVTVGGTELGNRSVVSSTEITGTGPALSAGSKDVVVASSSYGSGTCSGCILYLPPTAFAPPIAASFLYGCQLLAGSASCWGNNFYGQLGNGSNDAAPVPVAVSGGLAFTAIGAGGGHSCGLTSAGAAFCWGSNSAGQLGNGSTNSNVPAPVSGGMTFNQLTVGGGHTCGLTPNGTGFCWGAQPANGGTSNAAVPTAVVGGLRFGLLAAGGGFTCGLTPAGAAYCWGINTSGQLGNGTITNSSAPVPVSGGLTFIGMATGGEHACAITASGSVYCWGSNTAGQLGIGAFGGARLVPVALAGALTFSALAGGSLHSCGLTPSGAAYCWGFNQDGGLGNGSSTASNVPAPVLGGLTFSAVSAGEYQTCGVSGGATYCWGGDRFDELGNGTPETWLPVAVTGLDSVGLARAGPYGNYTCALRAGGVASCWGENNGGPLGDGTGTNRPLPGPVSGGLSFTTLAPAGNHNCGLIASGAAYCWGIGIFGELGAGATVFSGAPIAVTGGLTFGAITSGIHHTCGLTTSGAAYCWGENRLGQLGNGTGTNTNQPTAVAGGHVFSALAAGIWHTCGLEGTAVYCWGDLYGPSATPRWVNPSLDFVSIASGGWHSCALTSGGAAYCWGWNLKGGFGDGTPTSGSSSPVAVSGGLTFASLTVGNEHTCGLTTTGATYCWGYNKYGQIGNGTPAIRTTPLAIQSDPGFSALTAGENHTCGLTAAGVLSCWGDGYDGQLGRGTFGFATAPVATSPVASPALARD